MDKRSDFQMAQQSRVTVSDKDFVNIIAILNEMVCMNGEELIQLKKPQRLSGNSAVICI